VADDPQPMEQLLIYFERLKYYGVTATYQQRLAKPHRKPVYRAITAIRIQEDCETLSTAAKQWLFFGSGCSLRRYG
jgi:hypothetical protein